ncbi:hypothetical protein CEP53_015331, partial [Fusarium sp. AF-6]
MARTRVRGLSRVRGMAWASMTTPEDGRPSVEWERLGSSGARSTTWCIKPTDDSALCLFYPSDAAAEAEWATPVVA